MFETHPVKHFLPLLHPKNKARGSPAAKAALQSNLHWEFSSGKDNSNREHFQPSATGTDTSTTCSAFVWFFQAFYRLRAGAEDPESLQERWSPLLPGFGFPSWLLRYPISCRCGSAAQAPWCRCFLVWSLLRLCQDISPSSAATFGPPLPFSCHYHFHLCSLPGCRSFPLA